MLRIAVFAALKLDMIPSLELPFNGMFLCWRVTPGLTFQTDGSGKETFFGLRNPGLSKLIRDGSYDAVLCFVGYVRASFWIACRAAKSSASAFLFGTDTNTLAPRDGRRWKSTVKKILWPRLFRLADQVIVPSSGRARPNAVSRAA